MKMTFDAKSLARFLVTYTDLEDFKVKASALKGFDWNPFNEDEDEYDTPWKEIQHNWDLLWSAVVAFAHTVDRVLIGGQELTNRQKHAVVKEAIDRALILPWYLEPFDGMVIDMVIKAAAEFVHHVEFEDDPDDDGGPIEVTEWVEVG